MAATSDKPILVAAAYPAAGHTAGVLQLAQYLSGKGFKIYFIGGVEFKASIEKAGAEFIDFEWDWTKNWNEDEGGNVFY
ncbi:glycosyltransferase family 1 protein, partial [Canariomyces notabilis]